MSLEAIEQVVVAFVRDHRSWALAVVFLLVFGESLAVILVLSPATVILIDVDGLNGVTKHDFWPFWLAPQSRGAFRLVVLLHRIEA